MDIVPWVEARTRFWWDWAWHREDPDETDRTKRETSRRVCNFRSASFWLHQVDLDFVVQVPNVIFDRLEWYFVSAYIQEKCGDIPLFLPIRNTREIWLRCNPRREDRIWEEDARFDVSLFHFSQMNILRFLTTFMFVYVVCDFFGEMCCTLIFFNSKWSEKRKTDFFGFWIVYYDAYNFTSAHCAYLAY